MHPRLRPAALIAAGALIAALAPVLAPVSPAAATGRPAAPASRTSTVTLVTGDRVHLERFPDGRQAVSVEPGADGPGGGYDQVEIDGDLYVLPGEAMPYLAGGALDRQLFNITGLVEQGYDDARTKSIPLIARYRSDVRLNSAEEPAGSEAVRTLGSVRGRALTAEKRQARRFWEAVGAEAPMTTRTPKTPQLGAGIDRLWLDAKVRASLDRSVPQIGAPEAWSAGHDGTGVTVAVLDTGIDDTHPDLAGRITGARNFTDSPTTQDAFGHGTHVASTVAGTGAASQGSRKGVAPGAKLLIGKVLGDNGIGSLSSVLDGMEWAASSGADVVNMSLGSDTAGDGTDPLSLGLDELTETTGTLFVASAGNSGPGEYTVGTPGAADKALTVGAVDGEERLADFSSRGPRTDEAQKPDITAPGVGIVAARAAGTAMGEPVDDAYTASSGTSMAAPHVAGAAAILASQHPDWQAQQLKDALVSTSRTAPDRTVYEQGGGRVDVARAVKQPVHATGTVGFGELTPESGPQSAQLTYTNTGPTPLTLNLAAELRDAAGRPAPAGAVRLPEGATVTVPAGGRAGITVVLDPKSLPAGRYGGSLTATSGDGKSVAHTVLAAAKGAPRHKLTLTAVDRAGRPAWVTPLVLVGPHSRDDVVTALRPGETLTVSVPEGSYFLHGVISDRVENGSVQSVVVDPELTVDRDTHVVLDARKAVRVRIETAKPAVQEAVVSFYTHRAVGGRSISNGHMDFSADARRLYVTPTKKVTGGVFEFNSRWQLTAPQLTARSLRAGRAIDLEGGLLGRSPTVDGRRNLRLLDAGAGRPEDYAALRARGLRPAGAAVLMDATEARYEEQAVAAAAAGAAAVVLTEGEGGVAWTHWNPRGKRLPLPAVLTRHDIGERLRGQLRSGSTTLELRGIPHSPYLYDVMQVARQRVPERVVHRVTAANTATVVSRYHHTGGVPYATEQRFGWRPWMNTAINQYRRDVATPLTRTEYVSAGDTLWLHRVHHRLTWDDSSPLNSGMLQPARTYRPGERLTESWFAPVVRPAVPRGVKGLASYREQDELVVRIPEFADATAGHYSRPDGGDWDDTPADEVRAALYRDGKLLAEAPAAWEDFPVTGAGGRYRLDLDVERTTPEWSLSTATRTSWSFTAPRPPAGETPLLPLLQLDYDIPTDLTGTVGAPAARTLGFKVKARHQDGLTGPKVAGMEVSVSYDDGAHWSRARTAPEGDGTYRIRAAGSRTDGYVSLRVRAWDNRGNEVTQEVRRAFATN
ncbi:S8 family serine peptidase [Streptomyces anulatus]